MPLADVPPQVGRLDEVVAGVDVAVPLHRQGRAAGGGVDAQARGLAVPVAQGDVEQLHEDLADVAPYPVFEDADEEGAPLVGGHRALGDCVAIWHAVQAGPLDDGDQLDEAGAALVAQEAVDLDGVLGVGGVHGRQCVPLYAVLAERREAAHDLVEGGPADLVATISIVQLARAVDAQTDEKAVLLEEARPVAVDLGAVGLDGVGDGHARACVPVRQLDRPAEELETHEHGLAALPGDRDFGRAMRLDELPDVALEQLIAHARAPPRVQLLLLEEEAVGAVQVADRARRLRQEVEGRRRGRRRDRSAAAAQPVLCLAHVGSPRLLAPPVHASS